VKLALLSRTPNNNESYEHICKENIKFLVLRRERSQLECVGGPYNQELDGGDWIPEAESNEDPDFGFRNAAIRHAKEQIGLDLTSVNDWWRFIEINYARENGRQETCFIYLISLWDVLPSREEYLENWEIRERAKIELQQLKERKSKIAVEKAKREKSKKEKERVEAQLALDLAAAQPLIEEKAKKAELEGEEHEVTQEEKLTLVKDYFKITKAVPTNDDYKALLTSLNLSVKGTKQILIDRLYDHAITTKAEEEEKLLQEKKEQERIEEEEKARKAAENPVEIPVYATLEEELEAVFPIAPVVVDLNTAPNGVFICATTKKVKYQNLKAVLISLDGLLDYDLIDDAEVTFEVTLLAENFHDMLSRDFGNSVLAATQEYAVEQKQKQEARALRELAEKELKEKEKAEKAENERLQREQELAKEAEMQEEVQEIKEEGTTEDIPVVEKDEPIVEEKEEKEEEEEEEEVVKKVKKGKKATPKKS